MSNKFEIINPKEITDNLFKLIANDWALITAGPIKDFNTMTISWGTAGELWNRKVFFAFVRPPRFTYQFTEKYDSYTISFFDKKYRPALKLCGTKSGRDIDKVAESGLTPLQGENGSVYFDEARLVFECKKIYVDDIQPDKMIDPTIDEEYPEKDYHRIYVGEIINCLREA